MQFLRSYSIALAPLLALVSLLFSPEEVFSSPEQHIVFATKESLGRLTLLPADFDGLNKHPRGRTLGQALGKQTVPANKVLMISFFDNIQGNERAFSLLPPRVIVALDFHGTGVDDRTIVAMSKLPCLADLKLVDLSDTEITDASILALSNLKYLRTLVCSSTAIQGSNLTSLLKVTTLRKLYLGCNKIEPEALSRVAQLRQLECLNLARTGLDDKLAENLTKMSNLIHLEISDNPKLTDKGLALLRTLPKLKSIDLRNTGVTANGILAWRKSKLNAIDILKGQFLPAVERNLISSMKPITVSVEDRTSGEHESLFAPLR